MNRLSQAPSDVSRWGLLTWNELDMDNISYARFLSLHRQVSCAPYVPRPKGRGLLAHGVIKENLGRVEDFRFSHRLPLPAYCSSSIFKDCVTSNSQELQN